ncbi:kelch-like [Perkinsus chesapeaki]|uniref:Kelch-like n=1 Tax=Perkinsus chesapeaki TaxID=330153 RepID=A0A7J6M4K1_PERCH|nr:kelch-like [Perkinsus chesapeaki]
MAALPPAPPPPPSRSIRTQEDNPNAAAASTGAISATMPFKHELQCSTATVCEYVLDLFNKKKYADIVLIPNSTDQGGEFDTCERIYANRAILASWSPVFEHMLFPCVQAMENGANTLEGLPVIHLHCGYSTMHQAISYVYGHKVDLGLKDLWPLHCFLSTYQLKNEFGETVQRILEEAISVETCCELLNCVVELDGGGTGGDHYPLRKARRLILMEFNEVAKTEGYASLHWEILKDILASDDLTCAEEQVFHNAMRWVEADEARVAAHLEDILRLIRLPLMDSKVVAALDSHPVASRSQDLPKLQLAALKYHLNPAGAAAVGCRLRRAGESRTPTLNIYVQPADEEDEESDILVDDPLSRMVDELMDLDMISDYATGQELANILREGGQDLDKVTDELVRSRVEKPVTQKGKSSNAHGSAYHPSFKREVSDENDAVDTVVDLLTGLGFVDSREDALKLLDRLLLSTDDLNRVAEHIKRWAEDEECVDKAVSEDDEEVVKSAEKLEGDTAGKRLAKLLNDYGFVENQKSADELVDALEACNQDMDKVLYHFVHRSSKPVNRKPLPSPKEQQVQEDAAAKRGVDEEVKEYEAKERKSGRKVQPSEARWGWACPKHPCDPKADNVDILD